MIRPKRARVAERDWVRKMRREARTAVTQIVLIPIGSDLLGSFRALIALESFKVRPTDDWRCLQSWKVINKAITAQPARTLG